MNDELILTPYTYGFYVDEFEHGIPQEEIDKKFNETFDKAFSVKGVKGSLLNRILSEWGYTLADCLFLSMDERAKLIANLRDAVYQEVTKDMLYVTIETDQPCKKVKVEVRR